MEIVNERLWNRNYTKVWLANFMLFFSFMILTPLLPQYLNETYGIGEHAIGIILAGYTLTALLARLFSGYIIDSFPRKMVLLTCYFLFSLMFVGYLFTAWSLTLFAIIRTLHGAPFGATTVSNSTVAIDVLPSSRRSEGIGYYGLSNNIASAIGPSIGLYIYDVNGSYDLIFLVAVICSATGFVINSTLKLKPRKQVKEKQPMSLDRFFLVKGWSEGIAIICFALSYGVLSTYLFIYGKEELGITKGSGLFFMVLSVGLILSRLMGTRTLRQGKIVQNAAIGVSISVIGYFIFASVHNYWGYYGAALIIGLGNGHMFPAFQNMFINLAPNNKRGTANSSLLTSWDIGFGLGVLFGGSVAESYNYNATFWMAALVNAIGVLFFFSFVKKNYLRNKIR